MELGSHFTADDELALQPEFRHHRPRGRASRSSTVGSRPARLRCDRGRVLRLPRGGGRSRSPDRERCTSIPCSTICSSTTSGNLYTLQRAEPVRRAVGRTSRSGSPSNDVHLSTFADGWTDEHDLSVPLTGAMFDILVDIFHELLVARGLISPQVEELADLVEQRPGVRTRNSSPVRGDVPRQPWRLQGGTARRARPARPVSCTMSDPAFARLSQL